MGYYDKEESLDTAGVRLFIALGGSYDNIINIISIHATYETEDRGFPPCPCARWSSLVPLSGDQSHASAAAVEMSLWSLLHVVSLRK